MPQKTSSQAHNSMNRARQELAITFWTQSSPILTLVFLLVFIQLTWITSNAVEAIPCGIYYELEDDVVYVYAILDLRRGPLW